MQSKDPRFHALPLASQRVAAFADTVNELVYDVLISKVSPPLSLFLLGHTLISLGLPCLILIS